MVPFADATAAELKRSCGEDPGFVCRHVLDWTGDGDVAELAHWALDVPLKILAIVLGALLVSWLLRRGIGKTLRRLHSGALEERLGAARRGVPKALQATQETSLRAEQRIEALTGVLRSFVTFIVWTIAAFMILAEVGISLAPLLAGAGVIGVALGFGSQSLVKDFLSGIFILVEDQFGVGDIIDIENQVEGVVEGVSLRTTRLRSVDGVVWHVPNGEIRMVGNMSQHWSRSLLDVEVAYDTDVEQAKAVDQAGRRPPLEIGLGGPRGAGDVGGRGTRRQRHRPAPGRQNDPQRAVAGRPPAARGDQAGLRRGGDRDPLPPADGVAPGPSGRRRGLTG